MTPRVRTMHWLRTVFIIAMAAALFAAILCACFSMKQVLGASLSPRSPRSPHSSVHAYEMAHTESINQLHAVENFENFEQPADAALNTMMVRSRASQAIARAHLTEKKTAISSSALDALVPKLVATMNSAKAMSATQLEGVASQLVRANES